MATLAGCQGDFDEGDVTIAMSADGRILAGDFSCESDTVAPPESAIIYEVTGDGERPQELLWEGAWDDPPTEISISDIDLFASYSYLDGPIRSPHDLAELRDETVISVMLVGRGGYIAALGDLRQHPGEYRSEGRTGGFDDLRRTYCSDT